MHAPPERNHTPLLLCTAALLIIAATTCGCLQETRPPPAVVPPNVTPAMVSPIQVHFTPGEITRLCAAAGEEANRSLNGIAALTPGNRTIDTTLLAFERTMADYQDATRPLSRMGYVYPDPAVAAEGVACEEATNIFYMSAFSRRDLCDAIRAAVPRTPEESRLYNVTVREFKRNGLDLPDDRLARVRSLKANLTRTESRFSANLNSENTTLAFTREALAGVPDTSVATFREGQNDTLLLTTKYPDYIAVMTYADRPETRKGMYLAYNNRQAAENTRLLEEAIGLRQQIAEELGYATWADYRIDGRMAKNTSNVMAFLASLEGPLLEKNLADTAALLRVKQGLDPAAMSVDPWDLLYLEEKYKKLQYAYDEEQVREYFPVDRVLDGMFSICSRLYGIRFDEVQDAPAWSADVRLFRVSNQSDGALIGYLYLDLYPREGKYGHFATDSLINGRMKDGAYVHPVAIIMGNFPTPEKDRPSLLTPSDVWTLFHEMGHALHLLLTEAPYASLSGFNTEYDFVETPSQAFEEWVWDPGVLESISGHYSNTSRKIPPGLRDRVIAAQAVGKGNLFSRTLANSLEDMRFHTATGLVNVTEVSHRTYEEVTGIAPHPETHQPASFVHLMAGYDAGFYSYLWSKVYALEVVSEFQRDGMTNGTTGDRYRRDILERGNMEENDVLLRDFLGREPGMKGLYAHIGIDAPEARGTIPASPDTRELSLPAGAYISP